VTDVVDQSVSEAQALYHEGPTPPRDPEWRDSDWIEIPHEHFIPISKARLLRALEKLPAAQGGDAALPTVLRQLDTVYHLAFQHTFDVLKEDYEYFAPDVGASVRAGASADELLVRQRRFLSAFLETIVRGNFAPLTQREYSRALAQSYLFDLPVEINWSTLDERMLRDVYAWLDGESQASVRDRLGLSASSADSLGLPETFRDRVLVFHRGIVPDRTTGWFGVETIDILLSRVLGMVFLPVRWLASVFTSDRNAIGDSQSSDGAVDGGARGTVFERRWLRRVNLHNQSLLRGLFDASHLQEPALERVICLFRLRPQRPHGWFARLPLVRRFVQAGDSVRSLDGVDPTVHIKMFKHIPLADLEMIFPDTRIGMKPFDRAMLVVTAIGGCWAAWRAFESSHRSAAIVVLGVLAAYMVKLVLGYIRARNNYAAQMTRDLYHKNLDNYVGVLESLVDTVQEQEFKEAALVYCALLQARVPLTAVELDRSVETFLRREFPGVQVDFESGDALRKVVATEGDETLRGSIPLVRSHRGDDGIVRYEALPLAEAHAVLRQRKRQWLDEEDAAE